MKNSTPYEPVDGDFDEDADYTEIMHDIQREIGSPFGIFTEVAVSLGDNNETLRILTTQDGEGWDSDFSISIPSHWDKEKLESLFPNTVYFSPIVHFG